MDNTGRLYSEKDVEVMSAKERKKLIQVEGQNLTPRAIKAMKVGRNDPCPCGSGKKFKKCHLSFVLP
jgi:uncharacterized protein YecA (UPF0149 family)